MADGHVTLLEGVAQHGVVRCAIPDGLPLGIRLAAMPERTVAPPRSVQKCAGNRFAVHVDNPHFEDMPRA